MTSKILSCPAGGAGHSNYIICIGQNMYQCLYDLEVFKCTDSESLKFGEGMFKRKVASVDTAIATVEKDFE